ncbi:MAG: NAD(P)-dependent oxidoreductase, partial [Desulfurococcaceae archaeon]
RGDLMKVVYMFEPHKAGLEILKNHGINFVFYPGREASRPWLEKEIGDASVLVVAPWNKVDKSLIELGKMLKLIFVHGSGLDKVDVSEATRRGILVANAPDFIAESVADHILALILAHYRNIVRGDKYIRQRKWTGGTPSDLVGHVLRGKRVGIIGLGRIGAAVARRLKPFGAEVYYWDRKVKPEMEHALEISRLNIDQLIETSDIIVVSVALTPETQGLINKERIYRIKKGALLVNAARGQIIDEEALIERLRQGEIYAALDVFKEEPLPPNSPLIELDNVILTPHIGGLSWEALEETSKFVAEAIVKYIKEGQLPATVVNKELASLSW